MGGLADIYSGGNTLKRRLNALIKDPAGTLGLGVERFGEEQNQLLNLFRNAYPMPGNRTVLNSPKQIDQFRRELADKGTEQAMSAATVWHGTPHKFDKFDSSKIGTGEGAQAYGHGLYFAESPDVAKAYRSNLVKDASFLEKRTGRIISKDSPDYADLIETQARMERNGYGAAFDKKYEIQEGSLFKVDLPDEHIAKMLDWDKPLSQQHPDVQKAFNSPEVESMIQSLKQKGMLGDYSADELSKFKGEDWHDFIRQASGDSNVAPSELLKKQGIPGIRYLDGGSRGAGAGTSNYVVFPGAENMLTILERNGQPVNKLSQLLK